MLRHMCKSKVHRALVTQADPDYEGSITIDRAVMRAADLLPFERVQIANIRSGARMETYVIEGEEGSGLIGMNGAASRLARAGDHIHIISYTWLEDREAGNIRPKIIHLTKGNRLRHD